MEKFKIHSQIDPEVKSALKPTLLGRSWNDLSVDEKSLMWRHLRDYFFDERLRVVKNGYGQRDHSYYLFDGDDGEVRKGRVVYAIATITDEYKVKNYAPTFLENQTHNNACKDFYDIFLNGDESIVYELLSLYVKKIILNISNEKHAVFGSDSYKKSDESDEKFKERIKRQQEYILDKFNDRINEIFADFGIGKRFTRLGIVPTQSKLIESTIYDPVLEYLASSGEYSGIDDALRKAFEAYERKNYSNVIMESTNAVHSYLQVVTKTKPGKSKNLKPLLQEARKSGAIPTSPNIDILMDGVESYYAVTRSLKSNSHPKKGEDSLSKEEAGFVLNLTIVVLQHFINDK